MGSVSIETQPSLGREVAVKRAPPQLQPFLVREAQLTSHLEHPNILPIYEMVQDEGGGAAVRMRLIRGQTWAQKIDSLGLEANLKILLQVCNAVAYAHARQVMHGDLKPDNVMVGEFGEVTLLDWGLAAALVPSDSLPMAADRRGSWGTPGYMAPETSGRPEGEDGLPSPGAAGAGTDVFQLGAILYHILAGNTAYQADHVQALLSAVWRAAPPPPPGPPGLVAVVQKAMQRQVAHRYARVLDFRAAVEDWMKARLVEAALAARSPAEAEARLGEMTAVPAELRQRLELLKAEVQRERQLALAMDPQRDPGGRRLLMLAVGTAWTAMPLLIWAAELRLGENVVYPAMMILEDGLLLALAVAGAMLWPRIRQSQVNRDALVVAGTTLGGQFLLDLSFWVQGFPPHAALAQHLLLWAMAGAYQSLYHPRLLPLVPVFGAGWLMAIL
ncbi:MAG TPA: serine/threonine-protein kinase, partial [Myxococcota bacterium]|nr:serine/threonine-protein kinase [Myxococcota bacterium]